MDTQLFQNMLFTALSIFLIIVSAGFAVLIYYVVVVLKSIKELVEVIKKESEKIEEQKPKEDIDQFVNDWIKETLESGITATV